MQRPSSTQTPITPTAGSAQVKSPSHARAIEPSPIARRIWFTRPVEESSQLHAMPAATSGITWGRKSTVLAAVPRRPDATSRIRDATTRPRPTGTMLK